MTDITEPILNGRVSGSFDPKCYQGRSPKFRLDLASAVVQNAPALRDFIACSSILIAMRLFWSQGYEATGGGLGELVSGSDSLCCAQSREKPTKLPRPVSPQGARLFAVLMPSRCAPLDRAGNLGNRRRTRLLPSRAKQEHSANRQRSKRRGVLPTQLRPLHESSPRTKSRAIDPKCRHAQGSLADSSGQHRRMPRRCQVGAPRRPNADSHRRSAARRRRLVVPLLGTPRALFRRGPRLLRCRSLQTGRYREP